MLLTPMRYKDYTWPHNPEVYAVERRRRLAVHPVPFGQCVMQDLGSSYRVLRGEGVFAGENAYEEFRKLAAVFQEGGVGLLIHPVWRVERAWFASLTVEEEPLPDYVRYSFEFWEDWNGYDAALTEVEDTWSQNGAGSTAAPPSAASPSAAAAASAAAASAAEGKVYTVRKGDTLWGIAGRYGVELTDLIAANPQIKNPNLIYPGDQVRLP